MVSALGFVVGFSIVFVAFAHLLARSGKLLQHHYALSSSAGVAFCRRFAAS
jgi:hypothetical protein